MIDSIECERAGEEDEDEYLARVPQVAASTIIATGSVARRNGSESIDLSMRQEIVSRGER
jgi:hypothetical protein